MSVIETALGRVGVEIAGEGAVATPILFLHGVGSDKSVWRPQLDHFGPSRMAIAIDYLGYGESEFRVRLSRDDFAASALAVLDALEIERAHICGLSLGGVVAIAIHQQAPARCASLILADSFAVHPDGAAIHARSIAASDDMALMAAVRTPAIVAEGTDPRLIDELEAVMAGIPPAAFRQGAEAVWLADQCDRARGINVPTLVLVGSEDRITPRALSRELADLIPGSCYVEIAGAGHLTNIEQPGAFNAAVEAFLANIE